MSLARRGRSLCRPLLVLGRRLHEFRTDYGPSELRTPFPRHPRDVDGGREAANGCEQLQAKAMSIRSFNTRARGRANVIRPLDRWTASR